MTYYRLEHYPPWVALVWRIVKYYAMLLLLFALERTAFLFTHSSAIADASLSEVLSTYYHALHLDISTASYFCQIPWILLTLQMVFRSQMLEKILNVYTAIVIASIVLTAFANLFLYDEWGTKLNYRIWYYLQTPEEVLRTATLWQLLLGVGLGGILITLVQWLYLRWIRPPSMLPLRRSSFLSLLALPLGCLLIFVGMRGRITGVPITQSSAFFSSHTTLNEAATNTQWNLLKSTLCFYDSNRENIFATLDDTVAQSVVEELLPTPDSVIYVLNAERPNIVLIFLESWSADLVASLGGNPQIAPCFAELEKEGLLFTQIYAAGHRSQEGISTMISGNPPIPINVITDSFDKYKNLSSLSATLGSRAYATSFLFGGDLDYGNIKAYLMAMKFGSIWDERDFPRSTPRGSLSIYDELVFERHLQEMQKQSRPFFSVIFTGSSHSPYDVPRPPTPLQLDIPELPYVNSAHYTDYCLGRYFEKAKQEGWYDSTLFILVADHSHASYKEWHYYDAGYQRIPMLWLGGALREEWRGKQVDRYCSYIDLPATLLRQLGIDDSAFAWSRNALTVGGEEFAAVSVNAGIMWITPAGSMAIDVTHDRIYNDTFSDGTLREQAELRARAYLQESYRCYLEQ